MALARVVALATRCYDRRTKLTAASASEAVMSGRTWRTALGTQHLAVVEEAKAGHGQKGSYR